jgi:hypothetical protein
MDAYADVGLDKMADIALHIGKMGEWAMWLNIARAFFGAFILWGVCTYYATYGVFGPWATGRLKP